MVSRPGRPKASDLTDLEALEYARRYTEEFGVPPSLAPAVEGKVLPVKVLDAKWQKLAKRSLVVLRRNPDGKYEPELTTVGAAHLKSLKEASERVAGLEMGK